MLHAFQNAKTLDEKVTWNKKFQIKSFRVLIHELIFCLHSAFQSNLPTPFTGHGHWNGICKRIQSTKQFFFFFEYIKINRVPRCRFFCTYITQRQKFFQPFNNVGSKSQDINYKNNTHTHRLLTAYTNAPSCGKESIAGGALNQGQSLWWKHVMRWISYANIY